MTKDSAPARNSTKWCDMDMMRRSARWVFTVAVFVAACGAGPDSSLQSDRSHDLLTLSSPEESAPRDDSDVAAETADEVTTSDRYTPLAPSWPLHTSPEDVASEITDGGALGVATVVDETLVLDRIIWGGPEYEAGIVIETRFAVADLAIHGSDSILVALNPGPEAFATAVLHADGSLSDIEELRGFELAGVAATVFENPTHAIPTTCLEDYVAPSWSDPLDALVALIEETPQREGQKALSNIQDDAVDLADSMRTDPDAVTGRSYPLDDYEIFRQLVGGKEPTGRPNIPIRMATEGLHEYMMIVLVDSGTGEFLAWYEAVTFYGEASELVTVFGQPRNQADVEVWLVDIRLNPFEGCLLPDEIAAAARVHGELAMVIDYDRIAGSKRAFIDFASGKVSDF